MHPILHILAALVIGATLSVQPSINAVMAQVLRSPLLASCLSIAISLLLIIPLWFALDRGAVDLNQLRSLPWWVVFGGAIGVVFVAGSVLVVPRLGVASFFVFVVAGQLVTSVFVDHIGAFGMPVKPVNMMKLLGIALVLGGALMVQTAKPS